MPDTANRIDLSNYCLAALAATVLLLALAGVTAIGVWVFVVLLWAAIGTAAYVTSRH